MKPIKLYKTGAPYLSWSLLQCVEYGKFSIQEAWLMYCVVHLREFCNDPHPTNRTLAKMMGCSRRNIGHILENLKDRNLIDRIEKNGKYEFVLNPELTWGG